MYFAYQKSTQLVEPFFVSKHSEMKRFKKINMGNFFQNISNISNIKNLAITDKSLSEALILASSNPQYDKRLFIELQVQYMKITSSELLVYINCSECQNKNNLCTEHVLSL